ncbi:P-loop NTPase fold protein [Dickeya fangzhongdai]|uniref:P-loop NTPase fold protein n=1 Tax=Dickeya fangzhongdai TaxID=1778540 RepID=UPI0023E38AA2|nr:P-loop NTPase fold protein [Dickeya fangzhongdai]WES88625.1 hypothetical protein PQ617_20830 [Dickeya fangzhongdai]
MSTNNSSEIIIDLDNVFDLNRYDENTMLQYMAKEQLEQLLTGFVKNLKKYGEDSSCRQRCDADKRLNDIPRSNNTIFINGQRGTGKTTFLRAMLDYYSNNDEGICPLAFIDPTLIETHQNILVDIVVKFKQLYDERLKYCADEEINRHLNTCLEEMAEGLRLASHHKTNHDKHDDSWFLSQALKSAKSGQYLEERFHHFINAVAKALNKELFIIAIDDVDTHTQKAYDVLETIRRYLNHPRLVVLISGDLRLYNHIVKNQKQNELQSGGKKGNDEREVVDLVGHLTQQYMAKIFPAYQRVDLKLLIELIKCTRRINIKYEEVNLKSTFLSSHIESVFFNVLKIKPSQSIHYKDFLLSQPLRSIVQILKKSLEKNTAENLLSDRLRLVLKNIFIGDLIAEGIDRVLIESDVPNLNKVANAVFDLCYRHGELETGFYLRPDSDDDAYNAAKVYLAVLISQFFEKNTLSNALTFMLTCGAVINTFMHHIDGQNDNRSVIFKNYKEYIGLSRNENIITMSSHLGAVIFSGYRGERKIHEGVIRVNRRKINMRSFDNEAFNAITGWKHTDIIGSLDKLSSVINKKKNSVYEYNYIDYVAAVAVLVSSFSIQEGAEKRDYISILTLFSVMVRLLGTDKANIRHFMSIQTYGYPNFISDRKSIDISGEDGDLPEEDESEDKESVNVNIINQEIDEWKEDVCATMTCSPLLIGKVWERIQYTLNSISEKATAEKLRYEQSGDKGDILLGVLFSRMVLGVINSIMIEEVRFGSHVPQELVDALASAKNISTSSDEFVFNLRRINRVIDGGVVFFFRDVLPITYSMISFPLFLPFILGASSHISLKYEDYASLLKEIGAATNDGKRNIRNNKMTVEEKEINDVIRESINRKNDEHLYISKLIISGCFRKKDQKSEPQIDE